MITDFRRLLAELALGQVEFVVIGGVAAITHGSAQLTFDLDICYHRSEANLDRLCRTLAPFHPRLRGAPSGLPFRFDPPTVRAGLNFTLTLDIGDLDLLGEVPGLGEYQAVSALSQRLELFGQDVEVVSLEGLIRAKRTAGRPKDLLHLVELEALLEMEQQRKTGTADGL